MRTRNLLGLLMAAALVASSTASAQDPTPAEPADEIVAERTPEPEGLSVAHAVAIVGSCLGAGLCAIGGGYAIARIGAKCIEAIARQPEAAGAMFAPMIVSAAMVEGGMLFAITVCLLGVLKN